MHNLGTVFRFEIIRALKKKSFWIMSLAFPIMIAAVFGIVVASNNATGDAYEKIAEEKFSLAVTDESELINTSLLEGFEATVINDKQEGIDKVKANQLDAYFYYPKDVAKQPVEVYAKDSGIFNNSKYQSVASLFLNQSVTATVAEAQGAVLRDQVAYDQTTYREGEEYDAMMQMIAPGIFLVLFYMLIAFFGNQMLTSTTEEKENRVIEMILTTVEARTLIIGKILSLVVLGFLQGLIVITPVIIGYFLLRDQLAVPEFDLAEIPIDWTRIAIGAAVFVVSFMLFTGLLVTIGAAVPTAKEAANFFGIVMILIFGPLYAAPLFVSSPDSPIVQALSYFPFTAPIPLMLRNAVGNLEVWEALISVGVMAVTAVIILAIAVRVFKYGALEYSRKLSVREIVRPGK